MKLPPALAAKCLELAGHKRTSVIVPVPPSVNNLFCTVRAKHGTKRVRTKAYRDWCKAAMPAVCVLAKPVQLPAFMRYTLLGDVNRARDLGNIEKPITDLLVDAGLIPDDNLRYVHGIHLSFDASTTAAGVRVEFIT